MLRAATHPPVLGTSLPGVVWDEAPGGWWAGPAPRRGEGRRGSWALGKAGTRCSWAIQGGVFMQGLPAAARHPLQRTCVGTVREPGPSKGSGGCQGRGSASPCSRAEVGLTPGLRPPCPGSQVE